MTDAERVAAVIEKVLAKWMGVNDDPVQFARDINDGNCEAFACDVVDLLPEAAALWEDDADPHQAEFVHGSHCFVCYRGRYYDSERPYGVDDWRELPTFQRELVFKLRLQKLEETNS